VPGNRIRHAVMNAYTLRPRVCDLVFQLHGRPLHPELFDIVAVRKIQRQDYELTMRITRTGHVIAWDNSRVHLTEMAAADLAVSLRPGLLSYRLRGEQSAAFTCNGGIKYQMSFQVEILPPDIFFHVHDEIIADGGKRGLLHNCQPNHRLALAPLGFVAVETKAGCLFLSAFHTFPDEFTVVKTQSLIEMK